MDRNYQFKQGRSVGNRSLKSLALQASLAHEKSAAFRFEDSIYKLSLGRCHWWRTILTSLSEAGEFEEKLLLPLQKVFRENSAAAHYLEEHRLDKVRHRSMLNRYLKETFHYEKKGSFFPMPMIQGVLVSAASNWFERKPLHSMRAILFLENKGIQVHGALRSQTRKERLQNLNKILSQVYQDKNRHFKAMKTLLKLYNNQVVKE